MAGAAALVRQFLVEGHHATYSADGEAASSYDASNPSSALLKAILVGSTIPLTNGYDTNGNTVRPCWSVNSHSDFSRLAFP